MDIKLEIKEVSAPSPKYVIFFTRPDGVRDSVRVGEKKVLYYTAEYFRYGDFAIYESRFVEDCED